MQNRSKKLIQHIQEIISQNGGMISFAHFMQLALYHPEWGYYCSPEFDLGKAGDFTTAPEITPLFAKCFATPVSHLFSQIKTSHILEIGAGTGRFASVLLPELEKLESPCTHYFIYEISAPLRHKQQMLLQQICPHFFSRVTWLEQLPENFSGIVIANEVLDAIPTHCFYIDAHDIKERCVTWQNNQFTWLLHSPITKKLQEKVLSLQQTYHLPVHYASEINLQIPDFVQGITQALVKGAIFFIDYGYGQKEYYHPERQQGTLTCFHQHRAHADPFSHLGMQDITAHVDFTAVIESATTHCDLLGYTSQAAFLLDCGLLELATDAEKNLNIREQMQLHQAIKLLTMPTEMGERIKVMGIGKNVDVTFKGFGLKDRRRDL